MVKRITVVLTTAAALCAWPAISSAGTFHGVVISREGGLALVASPRGVVRSFRLHAAPGARVVVSRGRARIIGHSRHAVVRGTVVGRRNGHLLVAADRTVLDVNQPPSGSGTTVPQGNVARVDVGIGPSGLEGRRESDLGPGGGTKLQGSVSGVAPGLLTLVVNGQSFTIPVPPSVTLPQSLIGTTVNLSVEFADNGEMESSTGPNESENNTGGGTTDRTGTFGATGATGATGPTGASGPTGISGPTGTSGPDFSIDSGSEHQGAVEPSENEAGANSTGGATGGDGGGDS